MSCKITELRPEQKLLIKNFEGYKLSLDTVPIIKNKLTHIRPNVIVPNVDQYSLLHATLYGFHNHLYTDPWEPYTTYIIDMNNVLNKLVFNADTQRFVTGESGCQFILPQTDILDKIYNASLKFISEKYVLLSDGSNILYLIDTKDRQNLDKWKIVFSQSVVENENGFIIMDARLEETEGEKSIHCILLHIEKGEKTFENVIDWVVLTQNKDNTWSKSNFKQICGIGTLHYCSLEYGSKALYLASDHRYKFKLDELTKTVSNDSEVLSKQNDIDEKFSLKWYQSEEEVTLIGTFKEFVDKSLLNVTCDDNSVKICYKSTNLEAAIELLEKIDNDLTTWSMLDANNLEIVLNKKSSTHWQSLTIEGQRKYEEVPNPVTISKVHEQLKHLCTETQDEASVTSVAPIQDEIDDCDFDSDYDTKDLSLERLCPETGSSTHCIHIGPSAPLFKFSLEPDAPPILALRHDVDGLLWKMPNISTQWPPKHIGTLPAFGYVQASKQEKKFVSCSPDLKYTVICNANRHVFLYWGDSGGQLQNRKSKQMVQIGVQKVVTLDDVGDIIGLQAQNDVLLILTTECIIALQLTVI